MTLLWSFETSLGRIVDNHLAAYTDILIANITLQNGAVVLNENAVLSQIPRYWQISADGRNLYKSDRLKDWIAPKPERAGETQRLSVTDRDGTAIDAIQSSFIFPGGVTVTLISGLDANIVGAYLRAERLHLESPLAVILLIEGLFLVAASYVLTRHSIAPIRAVKAALAEIRQGRAERITGCYPDEIRALTDEINHLLDYAAGVVAKHRDLSSNLAHALKGPLTVIRNDPAVTREKIGQMIDIVDRNLARLHAAPSTHILAATVEISPIIDEIAAEFGRIHGKSIDVQAAEGLRFKGDQADLYEILGNIIENACKFARSTVKIGTVDDTIVIEDDGAGIPPSHWTAVLERGTRLDATKPGTGIGLAIARDIILLYKGDIALAGSVLGGLKVIVRLPIHR